MNFENFRLGQVNLPGIISRYYLILNAGLIIENSSLFMSAKKQNSKKISLKNHGEKVSMQKHIIFFVFWEVHNELCNELCNEFTSFTANSQQSSRRTSFYASAKFKLR